MLRSTPVKARGEWLDAAERVADVTAEMLDGEIHLAG